MGKYDPHICDDATAGDNSLLRARKTHFLSGDCFVPGGKILNLVVLSSSCIVLQFCLKSKSPYILISPAVLCRVWLIWRRGKLVDWPQICLPPHFTSTASDCLIGLDLFPSVIPVFSFSHNKVLTAQLMVLRYIGISYNVCSCPSIMC